MNDNNTEHEGWSNYPTWAIAYWINNDRGIYEHLKAHNFSDPYVMADYLEELTERNNPLRNDSTSFADVLSFALESVNFLEIAQEFLNP